MLLVSTATRQTLLGASASAASGAARKPLAS
jgi:hypothetical protein